MTTYSAAQPFKCLADINWLAIVIVKSINAPSAATNLLPGIVEALEKCFYLFANGRNIKRQSCRLVAASGMRRFFLVLL